MPHSPPRELYLGIGLPVDVFALNGFDSNIINRSVDLRVLIRCAFYCVGSVRQSHAHLRIDRNKKASQGLLGRRVGR